MVADNWSHTVVAGLVAQPHVMPTKVTVEYSHGATLVLEGVSLREFWGEISQGIFALLQIQSMMKTAEAAQAAQMSVPSEALRKQLNLHKAHKTEEKEDSTDTED